MRILPPLTAALAAALLASAGIVLAHLEPGTLGGMARAPAAERARDDEVPTVAESEDEADFRGMDELGAERCPLERAPASADPESRVRPPVAGTERWHRDRFDALARKDPEAFATEARATLAGSGELSEKMALLRVATRRDPELADELWRCALDLARGGDVALRDAALARLEGEAPRSAAARRRLLESALLVRELDVGVRRRAALAVSTNGDEALLGTLAPRIADEPDANVRAALLRGLRANPTPAAAALARTLEVAAIWRDAALACDRECSVPASEPAGDGT